MENIIPEGIIPLAGTGLSIVAGIIILGALFAIFKKIVKLGVTLLIIALIIAASGHTLNVVNQNFGVRVEEGVLVIDAGVKQHSIDLVDVVEIRATAAEVGMVNVEIDRKQGDKVTTTAQKMPKILYERLRDAVEPLLKQGGVQIKIIENF